MNPTDRPPGDAPKPLSRLRRVIWPLIAFAVIVAAIAGVTSVATLQDAKAKRPAPPTTGFPPPKAKAGSPDTSTAWRSLAAHPGVMVFGQPDSVLRTIASETSAGRPMKGPGGSRNGLYFGRPRLEVRSDSGSGIVYLDGIRAGTTRLAFVLEESGIHRLLVRTGPFPSDSTRCQGQVQIEWNEHLCVECTTHGISACREEPSRRQR